MLDIYNELVEFPEFDWDKEVSLWHKYAAALYFSLKSNTQDWGF